MTESIPVFQIQGNASTWCKLVDKLSVKLEQQMVKARILNDPAYKKVNKYGYAYKGNAVSSRRYRPTGNAFESPRYEPTMPSPSPLYRPTVYDYPTMNAENNNNNNDNHNHS